MSSLITLARADVTVSFRPRRASAQKKRGAQRFPGRRWLLLESAQEGDKRAAPAVNCRRGVFASTTPVSKVTRPLRQSRATWTLVTSRISAVMVACEPAKPVKTVSAHPTRPH